MPSREEILRSVYGAWRLARLDPGGMAYFEISLAAFWRSFAVAFLVAPFYVILELLNRPEAAAGLEAPAAANPSLTLFVAILKYGVDWVAFPLVMVPLAKLLGLSATYVAFIIAHNWSATIQVAVLVPAGLAVRSGLVGEGGGMLLMFVTVALLFYAWFIAKTALRTSGLTAAGLVAVETLLAIMISLTAGGAA